MRYILSLSLFFIAALLVVYSLHALKYRYLSKISNSFAAFMISLALYAAGYGGELLSSTLKGMLFWSTFQYFGIAFLPCLWIEFIAQYVNVPLFRIKPIRILLVVFSAVTLFGALTDPWLHLKYASVFVGTELEFPVLKFTRGPVYYFHVAYTLSSFMTGIALLINALFSTCRNFRKILILMIAGSSLPCIDFMLYLTNIRFSGIDTIPFSMFFSVLCAGRAVFSENLFESVPVARSLVFEMIADPVIVADTFDHITDYNKAAYALFPGIADGADYVTDLIKTETADDTEFQTDILFNGKTRRYSCHISRIPGIISKNELSGRIFLFRDITDSARLFEKMQELAMVDPLTGLYNRRYFMERTAQIISELAPTGGTLSFIIADLDLFKRINDTLGHLAGDKAIQHAAAAFSSTVRNGDIAARFGGEEFVCLLPDTSSDDAFHIAETIRIKIAGIPFPPDKLTKSVPESDPSAIPLSHPYITASFGVASADTVFSEQTMTALISRADKALYRSKNAGRNRTSIG